MDKLIAWFKDADNELLAAIVLFTVGILIALLGALIITAITAIAFKVVGGMIIAMGVIIVIFGFCSLVEYLGYS